MSQSTRRKANEHRSGGGLLRRPVSGALDDLTIFAGVAQHSSFVEASRRLAIPTSSVSRAVARLEDELGVLLLRRTSRNVLLTDEGRQLFLHARPHLEGLEEALASAADRHPEPSGVVRVTAPAFTGSTRVTEALASFAAAYPKITIELDASNLLRDLVHEGYDFGIRVGPLQHADFVTRRLWRGQFGLFASPAFAAQVLGTQTAISRATIEREACVVLRPGGTWRFVTPRSEPIAVTPCARFAVNDPRAALQVARRGLGMALAPVDAWLMDPEGLSRLHTDFGEPEAIDLFVVYPSRRLLPQRVRLAIDWLAELRGGPGVATSD